MHDVAMIAVSWLLAFVIIAPMFSPQMVDQTIWEKMTQKEDCHPPMMSEDLPWILYTGILGFILPFIALIVLQVMILIKKQESMEQVLNKFEDKVRANLTVSS